MGSSFASAAETERAQASWPAVQTLAGGTPVRITLRDRKLLCTFLRADEDGLTCTTRRAGVDVPMELARENIRAVRRRNLIGSTVGGVALGAGIGAGIGAIVDSRINNGSAKFTGGLGRAGGLMGVFFGLATEFVPGKLIYREAVERTTGTRKSN